MTAISTGDTLPVNGYYLDVSSFLEGSQEKEVSAVLNRLSMIKLTPGQVQRSQFLQAMINSDEQVDLKVLVEGKSGELKKVENLLIVKDGVIYNEEAEVLAIEVSEKTAIEITNLLALDHLLLSDNPLDAIPYLSPENFKLLDKYGSTLIGEVLLKPDKDSLGGIDNAILQQIMANKQASHSEFGHYLSHEHLIAILVKLLSSSLWGPSAQLAKFCCIYGKQMIYHLEFIFSALNKNAEQKNEIIKKLPYLLHFSESREFALDLINKFGRKDLLTALNFRDLTAMLGSHGEPSAAYLTNFSRNAGQQAYASLSNKIDRIRMNNHRHGVLTTPVPENAGDSNLQFVYNHEFDNIYNYPSLPIKAKYLLLSLFGPKGLNYMDPQRHAQAIERLRQEEAE